MSQTDTFSSANPEPMQRFERCVGELPALFARGVMRPNWMGDGGLYVAEGEPFCTHIYRYDPVTGERSSLFEVARVRSAVREATGHEPPYEGLPFSAFADLGDGENVRVQIEGQDWKLSRKTYRLERCPQASMLERMFGRDPATRLTPRTWLRRPWLGEAMPTPEVASPDGAWLGGVRDSNIYLRSTIDGRELALTECGSTDQHWDLESLRSKSSGPGRSTAVPYNPFSPNSLHLFACKVDLRRVFKAPIVNYLKSDEEVQWIACPRAGAEIDAHQPYLINLRSRRMVPLDIGEVRDHYCQFQAWLPDSSEALFVRVPRNFKTIILLAADALTGTVREVLRESAATFVRHWHEVVNGNCGFKLLPDGSGFLWLSERSGWKHIYHYDLQGKLLRQLTDGDWLVKDIEAVDIENGWVYFTGHTNASRPYDVHIGRVALVQGEPQILTTVPGDHAPKFAPNMSCFIDVHSAVDRPAQSDLYRSDGTLLATVAKTDPAALQNLGFRLPEDFTVKAADAVTDLWGVMYKPVGFDPNKRYPVVEYIYGGAQMAVAAHYLLMNDLGRFFSSYIGLAQLGYIVIVLDGRGTPGRSKAFHDAVYGEWGQHVVDDHAGAIKQLGERHPFMDLDRVGIYGHSWGGHFSFRCLASRPDVYHAAFSSAPGFSAWDSILYECYLDLPEHNKTAYDASDCFRLAGQVKGALTLAAGTSDNMCFHDALEMSRKLMDHDIEHELIAVTGDNHAYLGKGSDHVARKFLKFLERNVKDRGR
jgi:dipeptidyl-peptidase 4